jgi:hypothetical protein
MLRMPRLVAVVTLIAFALWAIGLPGWLQQANAAALTNVSDTLRDSDLGVPTDHLIRFTTPSGINEGRTLTLTFEAGFDLSLIGEDDIDIATGTDLTTAADCTGSEQVGVAVAGQVITFTFCAGDGGTVASSSAIAIEIGYNATSSGSSTAQIVNPGTAGSYSIDIGGTTYDSGSTRVAIIDDVIVSASVNQTLTFAISGVDAATSTNGDLVLTDSTSTATTVPFGTLAPGVPKTMAQDLSVSTNAANGFTVTVEANTTLTSSAGATIDPFYDGNGTSSPSAWASPSGTFGNADTYGHWGLTTEDASLSDGDSFGSALYVGNFVGTPREVFYSNGPGDGVSPDNGTTRVGYKVEITTLQEAGTDYTATLTYVATPIF